MSGNACEAQDIAERLAAYQQGLESGTLTDQGYACIGLYFPKRQENIGSVLRAAGCFRAAMVAMTGRKYQQASTDVGKIFRRIPVLQVDDLASVLPFRAIGVAVELIDGAISLPEYEHPKRAFYVFGGEHMTLGRNVFSWCRDRIYIPSQGSLNLGACVNVILYDRLCKQLTAVSRETIAEEGQEKS
jgi:tRNA(Leu) C34 or U34 (ribose-2'-O)-methylase TrmL